MEDSARFLYLAGGILVGVLILSLGVYLFVNFSRGATNIENQVAADQIEKFNSPYISYEGKEGITIYDIVNLAKKARNYNELNEFNDVDLSGHISVIVYEKKNQFLSDETNKNFGFTGSPTLTKDLTDLNQVPSDKELIDLLTEKGTKKVYDEEIPNSVPDSNGRMPKYYLPEYVCPNSGIICPDGGRIKCICFYKKY